MSSSSSSSSSNNTNSSWWWNNNKPKRRSPTDIIIASTSGGIIFWTSTVITQLVGGYIFRIAAHRWMASFMGCFAVAGSSIIALWAGENTIRNILHHQQQKTTTTTTTDNKQHLMTLNDIEQLTKQIFSALISIPTWFKMKGAHTSSTTTTTTTPLTNKYLSSLHLQSTNFTYTASFGVLGCIIFQILGGRFRSLFPSDYTQCGAFQHNLSALEATLKYAMPREKGYLDFAGKWFGCHTCGTRKRNIIFIADHQPPVKVAKRENARFYRKWTGWLVKQQYYPQCQSCSLQQSVLVRTDEKKSLKRMKFHIGVFRKYHLTGVVVVGLGLLCANETSD
jgi:hypothetical protein